MSKLNLLKSILLLWLLSAGACQSGNQDKAHDQDREYDKKKEHTVFQLKDFKSPILLKGTTVQLSKMILPSRISVIPEHNLLLILEGQPDDYFAKVYKLDSFTYLKSFIKKGEGPNEQLSCLTLQYNRGEELIYVSDLYKKKIFAYAIDSILSVSSSSLPVTSINMRTEYLSIPVVINQNKIVDIRPNLGEKQIALFNFYNKKGEFVFFRGTYPPIDKIYQPYQLMDVFAAGLNLSENGSRLILNYYNSDYIDLYDTTGELIKRVQGPDTFYPELTSKSVGGGMITTTTKKARRAYRSIAKMDKDIFLLYDGGLASREGYHVNRLFRFDQNLVPLQAYQLETPIFNFDIDWKSGLIYGLTHEIEGSIVVSKL